MMNNDAWHGKKVVVIGAARQGTALARYLSSKGALVILNDQRPCEAMAAVRHTMADLVNSGKVIWVCGGHPLELLDGADLLCPSGGVPLTIPLVREAINRGIPLSNDSQIFLEACPCRTVGITGSAGKTTTTTLVGRMARAAFGEDQVWVGGNIGVPLISALDQIKPEHLAILELSSFQLEIMTHTVNVAAVLNITPNHLDRHASLEAYTAAKARLVELQQAGEPVVLGRDDPGAWNLRHLAHGEVFSFGLQRPVAGAGSFVDERGDLAWWDGQAAHTLLPRQAISLRGEHNLQNVLAACAIARVVEVPANAMRQAVEGFTGVPHRLELVRRVNGIDWYNDSIATAPERAIADIHSFDEPLVLLAGGRDKNLPWEAFAELVHQRVDHLIVFGEASEKILQAIGETAPGSRPFTLSRCQGLEEAVHSAAQVAQPGDVVLLAPGGTSFDDFRDFEDRGEAYRKWVLELT
jgi:UDP-N-acetylmuramoylalanine--D-glutamate ligase